MPKVLPNWRAWHMINTDTGEELEGQFEAVNLVENPGAPSYAGFTSLNRENEILQFLHGNADSITFTARLYGATVIDSITEELNTLKRWIRRNSLTKRPPVIVFWAGAADIYLECVIENVANIRHDRLTFFGNLRGATIDISLRQYVPFDLKGTAEHETRYHHAKTGDYFELLAFREYGEPLFGDLLRRRHPGMDVPEAGDIVKLPSVGVLRKTQVAPHSHVFLDSYLDRDTATKRLRVEMFARRSSSYVSHILVEE